MSFAARSTIFARNLTAASLALAAGAAAASGFPDPAFGDGGVYVSPLSGNHGVTDGLIDAQGRYVAVGSRVSVPDNGSFVFRIGGNGQPDLSFNGTGEVQMVAPAGYAALVLDNVEQQGDGKLVIAGRVGPNFINAADAVPYVCRLLENGSLDPGFGDDGCAIQPYEAAATEETVSDLALQTDGRIVVLGTSIVAGLNNPAVLRLNADGSRDLCFNDVTCTAGGSVYDPVGGDNVFFFAALDIAPDGKIVLAGSGSGPQSTDMVVMRLQPTGAVDDAFGNAGTRTIAFELGGLNSDFASDVAVLDDSSIVLAGSADDSTSSKQAAVAKLTPQGAADIFFGQTGAGRSWTAYTDVSLSSVGTALTLQDDGKIVVGGTSYLGLDNTDADFAAWRLLDDGLTDTGFGFDGRITIDTGDDPEIKQEVRAIDADGKHIMLFGYRRLTNQSNLKTAFVRLEQDGVFGDGFEEVTD
jgi:uncharacterized delta-60 repeat protein